MEYLIMSIAVVVLTILANVLKGLAKKEDLPPTVEAPKVETEVPETEPPKEELPPVVEETETEKPKEEVIPEEPKEEVPPVVEDDKEETKAPTTEVVQPEVKEEEPKVEEVKKTYPTGKGRNVKENQIKILVGDLRIREGASTSTKVAGYATKGKYYTYTEVTAKDSNGIKWYKVDDYYIGDTGSGDLTVCKAGDYMIFPLKKYVWVSTKFSKDHTAVDFGWDRDYCTATQEIVAPYDMKVAKEGYDDVIGNYIYAHATYEGKKYTFRFIHLDSTSVEKGNSVKRGAVIGKMGNTGSSSGGHHLHFDILDGHRTTLPSDRYANSYDAMKMCYAPSNVVVDKETLADFTVLKV